MNHVCMYVPHSGKLGKHSASVGLWSDSASMCTAQTQTWRLTVPPRSFITAMDGDAEINWTLRFFPSRARRLSPSWAQVSCLPSLSRWRLALFLLLFLCFSSPSCSLCGVVAFLTFTVTSLVFLSFSFPTKTRRKWRLRIGCTQWR